MTVKKILSLSALLLALGNFTQTSFAAPARPNEEAAAHPDVQATLQHVAPTIPQLRVQFEAEEITEEEAISALEQHHRINGNRYMLITSAEAMRHISDPAFLCFESLRPLDMYALTRIQAHIREAEFGYVNHEFYALPNIETIRFCLQVVGFFERSIPISLIQPQHLQEGRRHLRPLVPLPSLYDTLRQSLARRKTAFANRESSDNSSDEDWELTQNPLQNIAQTVAAASRPTPPAVPPRRRPAAAPQAHAAAPVAAPADTVLNHVRLMIQPQHLQDGRQRLRPIPPRPQRISVPATHPVLDILEHRLGRMRAAFANMESSDNSSDEDWGDE